MELIACIAVYNDNDLIAGAIKSLADMDRIIIVDGATAGEAEDGPSTDGTFEYLTELAAKDKRVTVIPCEEPWADKIAKRNAYLVGAEGDWYFAIEAFERVYGASELKSFLDRATGADAFGLPLMPQPWAEQPIVARRLFKHLRGVRYEGSPDRVVCDEKTLIEPGESGPYLTDEDQMIAPRIVSVLHKRLKDKSEQPSGA